MVPDLDKYPLSPIECPYCGAWFSPSGMYWHLVFKHRIDKEDAYDEVGSILHEFYTDMNSDRYQGSMPEWRQ